MTRIEIAIQLEKFSWSFGSLPSPRCEIWWPPPLMLLDEGQIYGELRTDENGQASFGVCDGRVGLLCNCCTGHLVEILGDFSRRLWSNWANTHRN
ncbi:MAG: hypothetical protein JO211_03255 [Acidobacteriaceae bacterium]|nr:hypothetical protein [Acidobacteriaceae bacterium]